MLGNSAKQKSYEGRVVGPSATQPRGVSLPAAFLSALLFDKGRPRAIREAATRDVLDKAFAR